MLCCAADSCSVESLALDRGRLPVVVVVAVGFGEPGGVPVPGECEAVRAREISCNGY